VRNPATPDISQCPRHDPNRICRRFPWRGRVPSCSGWAKQRPTILTSFRGPGASGRRETSSTPLRADLGGAEVRHPRDLELVNDAAVGIIRSTSTSRGQILKRNGSASNVPDWERAQGFYRLRRRKRPDHHAVRDFAGCSWSTATTPCTRTTPCCCAGDHDAITFLSAADADPTRGVRFQAPTQLNKSSPMCSARSHAGHRIGTYRQAGFA